MGKYRIESKKYRLRGQNIVDAVVVYDDEVGVGKPYPPYEEYTTFTSPSLAVDYAGDRAYKERVDKAVAKLLRYIQKTKTRITKGDKKNERSEYDRQQP